MNKSKSNYARNLWQRYAVCIVALLVIALTPAYAGQPTAGVSFAQVSFTDSQAPQEYSHYGQVFIDYTMLYGSGYINVERYEGGKAVGWMVRNIPVISGSASPGFSPMFELGASGYQSSISAYVDFSPTPLADDSSLKGQVPLTYLLAHIAAPAEDSNSFEDVVCHKDDKKFWAGQQSVVQVLVNLGGFNFGEGTGWLIKAKDPEKALLITASHNFTDGQAKDTSVLVNYQTTECSGKKPEDFWAGEVDTVLERNQKLDFVVVSLKAAPKGRTYPPRLQALYKDIKLNDLVTIPQHPGGQYKKAGYYYDKENKKRCYVSPTAAINANNGEIDAKCGAAKGTSGSPLLDATETKGDDTPYAIGLITANRLKPLTAAGYKMSDICDYDASDKGKQLLDCKKP